MEEVAKQYVARSADWMEHLQCLFAHISHRFGRVDRQRHAWEYLLGLLGPVERKNGWQLAEAAQHATPYSLQHLLDRAPWDADAVRDDLVDYVVAELGESDGVLVADETGFVKKGTHSAGVQRHGGAHRELPGGRIPIVCEPTRARIDRSGIVFAQGMGGRQPAPGGGEGAARGGMCDEAGTGTADDRTGGGGTSAVRLDHR